MRLRALANVVVCPIGAATAVGVACVVAVAAIGTGTSLVGCASPSNADVGDAPFVATEADFQGYAAWEARAIAADVGLGDDAGAAGGHAGATRTVYVNRRPPHGSRSFPVGTILVLDMATGATPDTRTVFAMAKRGHGFNEDQAAGWEWFRLEDQNDGRVVVSWRGLGPPGDDDEADHGTCNRCHASTGGNDFVLSDALRLGAFEGRHVATSSRGGARDR